MNQHAAIDGGEGQSPSSENWATSPDPGSRSAARLTLLLLIPALIGVIFLQQWSVSTATREARAEAQTITPSGRADTFGLMSQLTVRFHHALVKLDPAKGPAMLDQAGYVETLDSYATSPHEKMRAAIVAAELADADEALARLNDVNQLVNESEDQLEAEYVAALRQDLSLLSSVYRGETITQDERQRLIDHHGWHAQLALSYGKDSDDPERKPLIDGGMALMVGLVAFGALVLLALLSGFAALIVLCVKLGSGSLRMRFVPPAPGGSVYLETFAVFLALFMALQLVAGLLGTSLPEAAQFSLQWVVLLAIFWPLVRGVSFARWRADLGLVAPEGLFKEVGAGLLVYLASLPVYVAAALTGLALVFLRSLISQAMSPGAAPVVEPPMSNPVIELVETTDPVTLIVLASLVTLWAPLVEELIMRGALYRHLRSRLHFVISAIVSALLFGLLHQYDLLMLLPVIALGAMFAFIREWRGSLIGCITAHALHNSTVFLLVVWLISST